MSPRTSAVSFVRTLPQLEPYLGATVEQLEYYADQLERSRLVELYTVTRGEKQRQVTRPTNEALKNIHRRMLSLLTGVSMDLPLHVTGYVRGRSIYINAVPHIGNRYLQRFDLKSFFDHVDQQSIVAGLVHYGFHEVVAVMLARLTTVNGRLPTGFATSPSIANIAMAAFDNQLVALADDLGVSVTRYADDITFSGAMHFDATESMLLLCQTHGHEINLDKVRTLKYGQPLYVTGLSTSESDAPRLPRPFKKRLRQELYYIGRYGLESHAQRVHVPADKLRLRLGGRIAYAESIEPAFVSRLLADLPGGTAAVRRAPSAESEEKRTASLIRLATRILVSEAVRAEPYVPSHTYLT